MVARVLVDDEHLVLEVHDDQQVGDLDVLDRGLAVGGGAGARVTGIDGELCAPDDRRIDGELGGPATAGGGVAGGPGGFWNPES